MAPIWARMFLYSGTVSAALEGAIQGYPSIATSLVNGFEKLADFSHGAEFIANFLPQVMKVGIPPKSILNINIPAVSLDRMAGVKVTELGTRMYTDSYERRVDPRGGVYFWLAGEVIDTTEAETSDVEAIRSNMVSISPVHYNLTNFSELTAASSQNWSKRDRLPSIPHKPPPCFSVC